MAQIWCAMAGDQSRSLSSQLPLCSACYVSFFPERVTHVTRDHRVEERERGGIGSGTAWGWMEVFSENKNQPGNKTLPQHTQTDLLSACLHIVEQWKLCSKITEPFHISLTHSCCLTHSCSKPRCKGCTDVLLIQADLKSEIFTCYTSEFLILVNAKTCPTC